MQRSTIHWLLFTGLLLVAPALLFMVQAVISMPTVFMLGGLLYMLPELFTGSNLIETLSFGGFFLFHLLIFCAVYWVISRVLAKLLCLIRSPTGRRVATQALVIGLASLAFLPVYGSGGHGPMRWTTLAGLCSDFDRSYKFPVALAVYGSSIGLWLLFYLFTFRRRIRQD